MKHKLMLFLVLFAPLLLTSPAYAHRLNIFAWLENDHIIVECDTGQNHPAANASVIIKDNVSGQELDHGVTGANGQFVFKVPESVRQGHGLLISVDAGTGHKRDWIMDAPELYAAAALTTGFDEAKIAEQQQDGGHVHLTPAAAPPIPAAQPVQNLGEDVKTLIAETLELQLAPIRRELAAQNSRGPGIVEIIGGLGWIIGLVGVALYFKSRKA